MFYSENCIYGTTFLLSLKLANETNVIYLLGSWKRWNTCSRCFAACTLLTESQNCRCWKEPLENSQSNPLLKKIPYSRVHSNVSRQILNILKMRLHNLSQLLCVTCSSALLPSKSSSCLYRTSCVPFCAHCPLFCGWVSPKRAWPHPLGTCLLDVCKL